MNEYPPTAFVKDTQDLKTTINGIYIWLLVTGIYLTQKPLNKAIMLLYIRLSDPYPLLNNSVYMETKVLYQTKSKWPLNINHVSV